MQKGHIISVVSGKGGVGKTFIASNLAVGLSEEGKKTIVIDFDIGQSNLDIVMGVEQRVVHTIIDVLKQDVKVEEAMVKVKRTDNLFFIASSQSHDKYSLESKEIKRILNYLKKHFDFIIIDAPAGIESGFEHAIEYADSAIIVVNPEVSSVRDSDRAIGLLDARSKKGHKINKAIILNRLDPKLIKEEKMLTSKDIMDILELPLLGKIPEDNQVLVHSNLGKPIIFNKKSKAGQAFRRISKRINGEKVDLVDVEVESKLKFW